MKRVSDTLGGGARRKEAQSLGLRPYTSAHFNQTPGLFLGAIVLNWDIFPIKGTRRGKKI